MGPIVIYYHVNSMGEKFNWTRKDCPQMMTLGYNGLKIHFPHSNYAPLLLLRQNFT